MQDSMILLYGLRTTVLISLVSLLISIIPGTLLYFGKKSNIKILYMICTAYIEFFEGIPLLAQLFFIYYALPLISPVLSFSPTLTTIIVFSLNGAANIASFTKIFSNIEHKIPTFQDKLKIVTLSIIKVFGEIIKYSSLLATIGMTELLRTSNQAMQATNNIKYIVIAIIIYSLLNIIFKAIIKILHRVFNDGTGYTHE